jgi:hypothetical protein
MSLPFMMRGAIGVAGRHTAVAQKSLQLPALMYMRHSFAAVQRRQEQQQMTIRSASTNAKVPTTILSEKEAMDLLNSQRSLRPNSPHMTIYQPQLTWYGSIFNRITGVGLSARKCGVLFAWLLLPFALKPFPSPLRSTIRMGSLLSCPSIHSSW